MLAPRPRISFVERCPIKKLDCCHIRLLIAEVVLSECTESLMTIGVPHSIGGAPSWLPLRGALLL